MVGEDSLDFMARYRDWSVSRSLSVASDTDPKRVSFFLISVREQVDKNDIRKRYAIGLVGLVIALAIAFGFTALSLPRWYLLICFIPLFMGAEGFYQGYLHFCAGFASRGIFDFTGSSSEKGSVIEKEAHKLDMQKAMQINIYSAITAAILTAIIYVV